MTDDAGSDRVPLWLIPLVMGGLMVLFVVVGHGLWEDSFRLRAAAQGTAGTAGTVTVTVTVTESEARGVGSKPCRGTFRPDGGGPEQHEVTVTTGPSGCVSGRELKVHLVGDQGVLLGAQDWLAYRASAVTLWVFVPLGGVLAILALRTEQRKRG
ncbi:hypothetical protein [Promicromonospora sp. NPDC023987]|uniref:hypothetical protein n=1 Tax=Promicromonospora sp. NPDC023987 TaxID=3155360 RepID=UPI0033CD7CDD